MATVDNSVDQSVDPSIDLLAAEDEDIEDEDDEQEDAGREWWETEGSLRRARVSLPDGSPAEVLDLDASESLMSKYGSPRPAEELAALFPPGHGGLIWHAQLIGEDPKFHPKGFDKDLSAGEIRPRRPTLPVRSSEFFASIVRVPDGRWIFDGVLNGWPGLCTLELVSITVRVKSPFGNASIKRAWDAERTPDVVPATTVGSKFRSVRATLRSVPSSAVGYEDGVPGHVWWWFSQRPEPLVAFGEGVQAAVKAHAAASKAAEPTATVAHLFAHRYARGYKKESAKEKLTYHAAVLLEWSHGEHCTVIELATLNGVGGRHGRSNWCEDKLAERPALYQAMPACMIAPWKGECAEIRCVDVEARTLSEFKAYVAKHEGHDRRFVDPHFTHTGPVRLMHRSQSDLARYLVNYIRRDPRYTEKVRNCQAFAADLYGFLAGKKGIVPHVSILRPMYTPRPHLFLYEASMYHNPSAHDALRLD